MVRQKWTRLPRAAVRSAFLELLNFTGQRPQQLGLGAPAWSRGLKMIVISNLNCSVILSFKS